MKERKLNQNEITNEIKLVCVLDQFYMCSLFCRSKVCDSIQKKTQNSTCDIICYLV